MIFSPEMDAIIIIWAALLMGALGLVVYVWRSK